jgi:hypothetical protein
MIIAFTGSVGLLALWVGSPRGTAIWIHDINGALTEDFGRFSGIFYRVAGDIRPSIDLTPMSGVSPHFSPAKMITYLRSTPVNYSSLCLLG